MMWPMYAILIMVMFVPGCTGHLINASEISRPDKDTRVSVEKQTVNINCPEIPEIKCPDVKCPVIPACPACPPFPDPSTWLKLITCPEVQQTTTAGPEATECPEVTPCPTTPTTTVITESTNSKEVSTVPEATQQPETQNYPEPLRFVKIYHQFVDSEGWVVFQRRVKGDVNFYRGWNDYKRGFGDFDGDFWLGNEVVHLLTSTGNWMLRVEFTFNDKNYYAKYTSFSVDGEDNKYKLSVSGYSGTAGDSLSYHNDMFFTTKDRDNDKLYGSTNNCAQHHYGAWWYKKCHIYGANLNGMWMSKLPGKGLTWKTATTFHNSATATVMKMRPWS